METTFSAKNKADPLAAGYFIYILECENGSYYTGYTKNLAQRYAQHTNGTANSSYTRSFKPKRIAQCWQLADTVGIALRIERWIKKQRKKTKALLVHRPERLKAMIQKRLHIEVNLEPFDWSDIVPTDAPQITAKK